MNKILRLTNRGLIVFVLLLAGVLIYLFVQDQADRRLESEFQAMTASFLADTRSAPVIPEDKRPSISLMPTSDDYYDAHNEGIMHEVYEESDYGYDTAVEYSGTLANEILDEYYSQNRETLDRYFSSQWIARTYALNHLIQSYYQQIFNGRYITETNPEIIRFGKFSVYKDEASLAFKTRDNIKYTDMYGESGESSGNFDEQIFFFREGDRWIISRYDTYRLSYDLTYTFNG
ncbi:MAG: hypothetical protein GXY43_01605 [Clostridiaceae bacterium]|nr:hypothetical protein [Clostridiaceae bacterium]